MRLPRWFRKLAVKRGLEWYALIVTIQCGMTAAVLSARSAAIPSVRCKHDVDC